MKEFKIKLLEHKRYFDIGWAFTTYIKYAIALFGISSLNVKLTLIFGFLYGVFCYFFGLVFVRYGWYEADQEVSNIYNRFVKEMRRKVINRKI